MIKNIFSALLLLIFNATSFAQSMSDEPEMAQGLYASGKIYVVVVVLLVILAGIILFLLRLDKKLNSLEKKIGTDNK